MRRRLATCFVLLLFVFFWIGTFKKSAEVVELVLPEDAVEGEPVGGLLHGRDGETAHADTAGFFLLDESCVFEHVEVFEDGGHGDVVRTGEFCDGGLSALQVGEDGPTRRIAEGGEDSVEAGRILNHKVMYYSRLGDMSRGLTFLCDLLNAATFKSS
jgi:hypothetical protein